MLASLMSSVSENGSCAIGVAVSNASLRGAAAHAPPVQVGQTTSATTIATSRLTPAPFCREPRRSLNALVLRIASEAVAETYMCTISVLSLPT